MSTKSSIYRSLSLLLLLLLFNCAPSEEPIEGLEDEGAFLVYRRQSLIGEETYSITSDKDKIVIYSMQGENERGRISGVQAELHLNRDLSPTYYVNRRISGDDTTNILRVEKRGNEVAVWEKEFDVFNSEPPSIFFPVHSNIPAAIEMMLYHYYFKQGEPEKIPTLPRGSISVAHKGEDIVHVGGKEVKLDRYVVEGINWGGRTIWLDQNKNLVALVKANTQIRELIRKGYEEALPVFVEGNVSEQLSMLEHYTNTLKSESHDTIALVGADLIDGLSDVTKRNTVLIITDGRIASIGSRAEVQIPQSAKVIDLTGKTLMPGLWDMHAHSNQVQWAPAYLAGGITTIRDNGNEVELATAFRDAIDNHGMIGPDILLAGMTDGAGIQGNGAVRATSEDEALEVVNMYHRLGYKQIKIYNSIQPEVLKVLAEEAHKRGMTVTGHVPEAVGNTVDAVELGMDHFSHSGLFMSILFPDSSITDLGRNFLNETEVSPDQVRKATSFLLENRVTLDPTINLSIIRNLPWGTPVETVEQDVARIAYELWEGKRFQNGVSPEVAEQAKVGYTRAMKILGEFNRAGVSIVAGTDNAVPVFCLYLEIEAYQKLGGFSPFEAIKAATINPAKVMGMDKETGTLEVGKEADIAILDKNPLEDISNLRTVYAVVTNGTYYESEPMWSAVDFIPRNQ